MKLITVELYFLSKSKKKFESFWLLVKAHLIVWIGSYFWNLNCRQNKRAPTHSKNLNFVGVDVTNCPIS